MTDTNNTTDLVVFYGSSHGADQWARENGLQRRDVVLATNPDGLRGQSRPVREVFDAGWEPSPGQADLLRQTQDNIALVKMTQPATACPTCGRTA